jgi:hypothetical protein
MQQGVLAGNERAYLERIGHLLTRPVGRPPNEVRRLHASFSYQAGSWTKQRRVVAKVDRIRASFALATAASAGCPTSCAPAALSATAWPCQRRQIRGSLHPNGGPSGESRRNLNGRRPK